MSTAPASAQSPPSDASTPATSATATPLHLRAARACARHVGAAGRELAARPRLRTGLAGALLLLAGLLTGVATVVGLVLVAVGGLMLLVAWAGSRLDGRLAIAFGPDGTTVELRTRISASPEREAPVAAATAPVIQLVTPVPDAGDRVERAPAVDPDVIESTGKTIELDVEQLRALLAAERGTA